MLTSHLMADVFNAGLAYVIGLFVGCVIGVRFPGIVAPFVTSWSGMILFVSLVGMAIVLW